MVVLEIDGSFGEGGGQILRSALTLALLGQRPFRIKDIRGGRKKPGLRAQHLAAIRAAQTVGRAYVEGDRMGSEDLVFVPSGIFPGDYRIEIGTAGSCSLVLQTILLPLAHAGGTSSVVIVGGTHVPWSPTFEYIDQVWSPSLELLGYQAKIELIKAGFYPKGGGLIEATIRPASRSAAILQERRSPISGFKGVSLSSNLPLHVAERQRKRMMERLDPINQSVEIEIQQLASPGVGSAVFISGLSQPAFFGFSALGAKGKPAEQVADEGVDQLLSFLNTSAVTDRYLSDQLLIPLAFSSEDSTLIVEAVTSHLTTNAEIVRMFLDVDVHISDADQNGCAHVKIGSGKFN
jgi:RNA 3'-phosphate cyclase